MSFINKINKVLIFNYLYKNKRYFGGLKESSEYDLLHGINPKFVKELIEKCWNKKQNESDTNLQEEINIKTKDKIYARLLASEYKYATICLLSMFIVSILLMLIVPDSIALFLLVLVIGSLFLVITSFKKCILWSNGASGEEKVATELKKLGKDFLIVNDLKLPNYKGNIDHLVLSKNGIFIIETKNHNGDINCDGDYWKQENIGFFKIFQKELDSPSKQVKKTAVRLKEFLKQNLDFTGKLWFETIVVFSNKNSNLKEITNPTVTVLKVEELNKFIRTHKNINLTQREMNSLITQLNKVQIKEEDTKIFRSLWDDIKIQIKSPDYWKYTKFGLIFGLFWLLFDEIFHYTVMGYFYYAPLDIMYIFFIGGLISFLLGKFFLDILAFKSQSNVANLILISLLGWSPFLLEIWIFIGFSLPTSLLYILARFALIFPVIIIFNLLRWRI